MVQPERYPKRYLELADRYESDAHWARSPADRAIAEEQLTILQELAIAERALEEQGIVNFEYGVAFDAQLKTLAQLPVMRMSESEIEQLKDSLSSEAKSHIITMRRRATVDPGPWETVAEPEVQVD